MGTTRLRNQTYHPSASHLWKPSQVSPPSPLGDSTCMLADPSKKISNSSPVHRQKDTVGILPSRAHFTAGRLGLDLAKALTPQGSIFLSVKWECSQRCPLEIWEVDPSRTCLSGCLCPSWHPGAPRSLDRARWVARGQSGTVPMAPGEQEQLQEPPGDDG